MIETGQAKNESDLARKIGVSRVRVCHYVRLLSLNDSVIKALERLGDLMPKRYVPERKLRTCVKDHKSQSKLLANLSAIRTNNTVF
jgi:hypothetical protein